MMPLIQTRKFMDNIRISREAVCAPELTSKPWLPVDNGCLGAQVLSSHWPTPSQKPYFFWRPGENLAEQLDSNLDGVAQAAASSSSVSLAKSVRFRFVPKHQRASSVLTDFRIIHSCIRVIRDQYVAVEDQYYVSLKKAPCDSREILSARY